MRYGPTITGVTRRISKEALHVDLGLKKNPQIQQYGKLYSFFKI